jgi:hypothetical protein
LTLSAALSCSLKSIKRTDLMIFLSLFGRSIRLGVLLAGRLATISRAVNWRRLLIDLDSCAV